MPDAAIEAEIEKAIDAVLLTREQLTLRYFSDLGARQLRAPLNRFFSVANATQHETS